MTGSWWGPSTRCRRWSSSWNWPAWPGTGVIYFDTFPDHGGLDPVAEGAANVMMADRLRAVAARLAQDERLAAAVARQDAAASLHVVAEALYGPAAR